VGEFFLIAIENFDRGVLFWWIVEGGGGVLKKGVFNFFLKNSLF